MTRAVDNNPSWTVNRRGVLIVFAHILFLLFPRNHLFAQQEIWLSFGKTGPTTSYLIDQSEFLVHHWTDGLSLAIGSNLHVHHSIWLTAGIEYAYYRWDNHNYYRSWVSDYSIRSVGGEDSHIYRMFVNARFYAHPPELLPVFLFTGIGYTIENIGRIHAIVDNVNGPSFQVESGFSGRSYLTHTFGAGFRIDIMEPISFEATAKCFTEYARRIHTSVHLGLNYTFW